MYRPRLTDPVELGLEVRHCLQERSSWSPWEEDGLMNAEREQCPPPSLHSASAPLTQGSLNMPRHETPRPCQGTSEEPDGAWPGADTPWPEHGPHACRVPRQCSCRTPPLIGPSFDPLLPKPSRPRAPCDTV